MTNKQIKEQFDFLENRIDGVVHILEDLKKAIGRIEQAQPIDRSRSPDPLDHYTDKPT